MKTPLSYSFFSLIFFSVLTCHASESLPLPDIESQDILTPNDSPRGNLRGIMQLREYKSVPYELAVHPSSEEENLHRKLSTASTTPNSRKFSFPALTPFLKLGDTIMVLEDTETCRKVLVARLKRLGFNVIPTIYGYQAYDAAVAAAKDGIKIPLFLFDFNVPFKEEEVAARLFCGQRQLNGGQATRLIKQLMQENNKPFESSVFVCLTGTPKDAEGFEDVFWQIRDKLTEPNAEDFFRDVRHQLMVSEIASFVVPNIMKRGTSKALSRAPTQPNTPDSEEAGK